MLGLHSEVYLQAFIWRAQRAFDQIRVTTTKMLISWQPLLFLYLLLYILYPSWWRSRVLALYAAKKSRTVVSLTAFSPSGFQT